MKNSIRDNYEKRWHIFSKLDMKLQSWELGPMIMRWMTDYIAYRCIDLNFKFQ